MKEFIESLRYESSQLDSEFKQASVFGGGTPQEVSDCRENAFTSFLEKYYPFPYRVAKGNIWDSFGNKSASIDSIIINPNHPYTIDRKKKFSIILADGVDSAIELKPDLSNKTELMRSLKQINSVKQLRRARPPILYASRRPEKFRQHVCQIPSFIFTMKAYKSASNTYEAIINGCKEMGISKMDQPDYIVINDKGILYNHKVDDPDRPGMNKNRKEGCFYYEEYNKDTLAMFLLILNVVPPAEIPVVSKMLPYYLRSIELSKVTEFGE